MGNGIPPMSHILQEISSRCISDVERPNRRPEIKAEPPKIGA
jgi:hypothetical protein